MRDKKKKRLNEGTLFDDLEKLIEAGVPPVDLNSKLRDFESRRSTDREIIHGAAVIYDLRENLITKAEFRNLSEGGVCFEIPNADLRPLDEVYVDFSSGVNLGMVLCVVQWVNAIDGHRRGHKTIGFRFKELTALKRKLIAEFLEKVRREKNHDPFYGS